MTAPFLRIVRSTAHGLDKEASLRQACEAVRAGRPHALLFHTDPRQFSLFAESPFVYWISDDLRSKFAALPPLEPTLAEVRLGGHSGNDSRWLRLWFEIDPKRFGRSSGYASFAKGGKFAPYYADIDLVVAWDDVRRTYRDFYGRRGRWTERPEALDYYFRQGLTYPYQAGHLNVRALPEGCAFGHGGPCMFTHNSRDLLPLLGLLNSALVEYLEGFRSPVADSYAGGITKPHEVGSLQILPVPQQLDARIGRLAEGLYDLHRVRARNIETTHDFVAPVLATARGSLAEEAKRAVEEQEGIRAQCVALQSELDDLVFESYGIGSRDRAQIVQDLRSTADSEAQPVKAHLDGDDEVGDIADGAGCSEDEPEESSLLDEPDDVADGGSPPLRRSCEQLLSYAVGCAFGRWDIRLALGSRTVPALGGPFAPLSRCARGMLVDDAGLPATEAPRNYPIEVAWDGVLVDDKDHPRDVVARVYQVLEVLFGKRAGDRIAELVDVLGGPADGLRGFLRQQFFERVHRPMYTMAGNPPRRAPIYWSMYPRVGRSRRQAGYGVWLYYHRLTSNTLFEVYRDILLLKLKAEESLIQRFEVELGTEVKGRAARELQEKLRPRKELVEALRPFAAEVLRVAELRCIPDFDDGVLLNCAILYALNGWKDAGKAWQAFEQGKFDWSNLAQRLRPKEAKAYRDAERKAAEAAASGRTGRRRKGS